MYTQLSGPTSPRPIALALVLLCGLSLASCSNSTAPVDPPPSDGNVVFEGKFGQTEFLLQRVTQPTPDGRFVEIDLVGKNVVLDDTGEGVSVDVAIHNGANMRGVQVDLFPPVMVSLRNFQPPGVMVTNADFVLGDSLAPGVAPPSAAVWIFDYSAQLGEDGVLSPGETSAFRTWEFRDVGQGPFSFEAGVDFSLEPDRPRVGGVVFTDLNRNGQLDGDESGSSFGDVEVLRPDGSREIGRTDPDGRWSVPVKEPGLYTLTFIPPPTMSLLPVCLTTPNPLTVLLTPGPDGLARSFDQADFGIDPEPCFLPAVPFVEVVETRPDPAQIPQDQYHLIEIGLRGDRLLRLRVGYSGCSPEHPLRLFAGKFFAESLPPQTWALLAHDSRGELCDAYFEQEIYFDLSPLRREHFEQYGAPGPFVLNFEDYLGMVHRILVP